MAIGHAAASGQRSRAVQPHNSVGEIGDRTDVSVLRKEPDALRARRGTPLAEDIAVGDTVCCRCSPSDTSLMIR